MNKINSVYHGEHGLRTLKELARSYLTITKDLTRVMNRLKALYRSWGIPCFGNQVYAPRYRAEWLGKISEAKRNQSSRRCLARCLCSATGSTSRSTWTPACASKRYISTASAAQSSPASWSSGLSMMMSPLFLMRNSLPTCNTIPVALSSPPPGSSNFGRSADREERHASGVDRNPLQCMRGPSKKSQRSRKPDFVAGGNRSSNP